MTLRTLLVDDDPDTRALFTLALESDGRFAVTATSRLEVATLGESANFDGVVIHVTGSESDKSGPVATIRQWAATIPIVLLGAGAIAKPIDPLTLAEQIVAILG